MCSGETKGECYTHRVLGLPRGRLADVSRIRRGAALFLYDFTSRHLYGPYRADSDGGLSLIPAAFHGRYPAQVKFAIDGDFMAIPKSSLRSVIKENYSRGKFYPELTLAQVEKLRALFRPINVLPEHAVAQYVDGRYPAPHTVYVPHASHPAQPAAYVHHPTSCVPPTDLHPMSYGPTALLVQPDAYAQYAQLPPPMAQFTTPAYVSAMGSPYQAAYTAYGPLPSTCQYVQVPPSHFHYAQQFSSGHVSAPGYSTDSYYAAHRYGTHQVDTVGSYYQKSTSERIAFATPSSWQQPRHL